MVIIDIEGCSGSRTAQPYIGEHHSLQWKLESSAHSRQLLTIPIPDTFNGSEEYL